MLQTLLSLDPASRSFQWFQTVFPTEDSGSVAERVLRSAQLDVTYSNKTAKALITRQKAPCECGDVMDHAMYTRNVQRNINGHIDSALSAALEWSRHLAVQRRVYRYHRHFVQVVNAQSDPFLPEHWLFKEPTHMYNLPLLLEQYPNARIVWTHRNILDMATCNVGRAVDKRLALSALRSGPDNAGVALNTRKHTINAETRFVDVYFEDLQSDPIAVIRTIYAKFHKTVSPAHEKAMRKWLKKNMRKPKEHGLSVKDCGYASIQQLNEDYSEYLQWFPRCKTTPKHVEL